jgi:hypothetical protein
MFRFWHIPIKTEDSNENLVWFKNHYLPKGIQTNHCLLLWKTIINDIQSCMPSPQVWAIAQVVVDTLQLVV